MSDEHMTMIEINGIKMEVDLRHAKRIESFRIGDRVKVLVKEYQDYKPYPGVIVGFDAFTAKPTITVAYLSNSYNDAELRFVYISPESTNIEMVHIDDGDTGLYDYSVISECFDRKIRKLTAEVQELEAKRDYFMQRAGVVETITDNGETK